MDEQRFCSVDFLDVGIGYTWLEVEHGVGIEAEGAQDTIDFGILGRIVSIYHSISTANKLHYLDELLLFCL